METYWKEVDFGLYCEKCKHYKNPEDKFPCDECLEEPARQYSHKPVKFEEADR